jgi:ketosteroid isomerase-like protein
MAGDPNIAVLESVYAEWARGDYSRNDFIDPDVEFVTGVPERRVYHGREGMRQGWTGFLSAWTDFTTAVEEIVAVPGTENRYVATVRLKGLGKGSGVPIETVGANIIDMRDGRIVYFEIVRDSDAVLEELGIADR